MDTGSGPVYYDIYYNSKVPPKQFAGNVSSDSFSFIKANYSTTYYWYVVPKNASGTAIGCLTYVTSFTTSDPPSVPSNDNCNGATSLTLVMAGTTLGATESQPAILCSGYTGTADDDVWYDFTPTKSGTTIIPLSGKVDFDGVLQIFAGVCGSLNSVACSDTSQVGGTEQITLNVTAQQGLTTKCAYTALTAI